MTQTLDIPLVSIYQKIHCTIPSETQYIRSPEEGLRIVQPLIADTDREHFVVVGLNAKNVPTSIEVAHIGALNSCIVHPREIFKNAILSNSAAIFLAHNHPSQNITPSPEDIAMTERLVEAGELLGIEVLDHIIINNQNNFYSMKENHHL